MGSFTEREQIVEVVNKLFIYTDHQDWYKLQNEVFSKNVHLDMTSMGGEARELASSEICTNWENGFKDLDAVNHLGGNYVVTINDDKATVFAYATATHYKEKAKKGTTRNFVGTYELQLVKNHNGWRIDTMKYNLRYAHGNMHLK
ncbi:MAG: nuclear transport factor 2 family protein [Flavobacteriaceae bacterium]|nr:nuclear transport factor 2 family protein [Flavobacteriaceae bacterium]